VLPVWLPASRPVLDFEANAPTCSARPQPRIDPARHRRRWTRLQRTRWATTWPTSWLASRAGRTRYGRQRRVADADGTGLFQPRTVPASTPPTCSVGSSTAAPWRSGLATGSSDDHRYRSTFRGPKTPRCSQARFSQVKAHLSARLC
jgi:hypothetical protein